MLKNTINNCNIFLHVRPSPVLVWQRDPSISADCYRQLDLAYCAGLFDGDGCISISKTHRPDRKNPTYRLCLSLVQNCLMTVKRFQGVIDVLSMLVEPTRTVQQNRQVYDLRYDGKNSLRVLEMLRPYLVRKSAEADVAIQFMLLGKMSVHTGPKGAPPEIWKIREQLYRKLRALK